MPRFSLHAIGRDRPGIVAAITGPLAAMGANLEDSRMTILQGQFAVMLVVETETPDGWALERALEDVAEELNLAVTVRPLPEIDPAPPAALAVTVRLHGSDRAGMVAYMATVCAAQNANIVELIGRVRGEDDSALEIHLELSDAADLAALTVALEEAASHLEVRCAIDAVPID
jgi:glycine cleavage system transcriptional repressor